MSLLSLTDYLLDWGRKETRARRTQEATRRDISLLNCTGIYNLAAMGKNKRPKSYYVQLAKKQKTHHNVLSPGLTGFLCTCNDRERECVLEAYNILNEYADQLYGKEVMPDTKVVVEEKSSEATQESTEKQPDNSKEETEKDLSQSQQKQEEVEGASDSDEEFSSLDAAIKADVEELQKESEKKHRHLRRFGQVATGAKNYVFIRSTLEDPLPLSLTIMDDILKLQRQKNKKTYSHDSSTSNMQRLSG